MFIFAKVEAAVVNEFEAMKDEIKNIAFNDGMLVFPYYIEKWKVLLLRKVILTLMKGNPSLKKYTQFIKMLERVSIIKRII
jgi:hypothetical protein